MLEMQANKMCGSSLRDTYLYIYYYTFFQSCRRPLRDLPPFMASSVFQLLPSGANLMIMNPALHPVLGGGRGRKPTHTRMLVGRACS